MVIESVLNHDALEQRVNNSRLQVDLKKDFVNNLWV
jgi:hypothetical protein